MRKLDKTIFFVILIIAFAISGCDRDYGYAGESGGDIGGEQSLMGEIGNTFGFSTLSGLEDVSAIVTKLDDGISTISVSATITDPKMKELLELIPSFDFGSYNPSTGECTGELKMKFTDKGIVDYLNTKDRPFTIVKFSDKVGDKYTYDRVGGGKVTREVTERSDQDDFPYGFFDIKTMTVEEPGRNPAIKKIVYKLNHRFGLVHVSVVMQDGSEVGSYLYSAAENE